MSNLLEESWRRMLGSASSLLQYFVFVTPFAENPVSHTLLRTGKEQSQCLWQLVYIHHELCCKSHQATFFWTVTILCLSLMSFLKSIHRFRVTYFLAYANLLRKDSELMNLLFRKICFKRCAHIVETLDQFVKYYAFSPTNSLFHSKLSYQHKQSKNFHFYFILLLALKTFVYFLCKDRFSLLIFPNIYVRKASLNNQDTSLIRSFKLREMSVKKPCKATLSTNKISPRGNHLTVVWSISVLCLLS